MHRVQKRQTHTRTDTVNSDKHRHTHTHSCFIRLKATAGFTCSGLINLKTMELRIFHIAVNYEPGCRQIRYLVHCEGLEVALIFLE